MENLTTTTFASMPAHQLQRGERFKLREHDSDVLVAISKDLEDRASKVIVDAITEASGRRFLVELEDREPVYAAKYAPPRVAAKALLRKATELMDEIVLAFDAETYCVHEATLGAAMDFMELARQELDQLVDDTEE